MRRLLEQGAVVVHCGRRIIPDAMLCIGQRRHCAFFPGNKSSLSPFFHTGFNLFVVAGIENNEALKWREPRRAEWLSKQIGRIRTDEFQIRLAHKR